MAKYRMPVLEDFSWQPPVTQIDLNGAPGAPSKGDRYIVAAGVPTGDDWFGEEDSIAWYDGAAWQFDTPVEGWYCYDKDTNILYHFDGSDWDADDISGLEADVVSIDTRVTNVESSVDSIDTVVDGKLTGEYVSEYGAIEVTI